jgi:hypothetical protein
MSDETQLGDGESWYLITGLIPKTDRAYFGLDIPAGF